MLLLTIVLLLQTPATEPLTPEDPGKMVEQKTWVGCVQAGSVPSTYRLNLDPGTAVAGPDDPASLGSPFVQLVGDGAKLNLTRYVGKHVKVTGKPLSAEEAAREAANRPDRQEAAETAAGTGGRPQRHMRYVKVEKIEAAAGECK
jgi:hypothetical protein